jgi:hypothetical protein
MHRTALIFLILQTLLRYTAVHQWCHDCTRYLIVHEHGSMVCSALIFRDLKIRHHPDTFLRHPPSLLFTLANLNTKPDRDFSLLTPLDLGSVDYPTMCDWTEVIYDCRHLRYIVRSWCDRYAQKQKRCPLNIVAV